MGELATLSGGLGTLEIRLEDSFTASTPSLDQLIPFLSRL